MAMAMREAAGKLITAWRRRHGSELGIGIGIAQGYAPLGSDRHFRTPRLHGDRHGMQPRRSTLCRLARSKHREVRRPRKPGAKRSWPTGRAIQRRGAGWHGTRRGLTQGGGAARNAERCPRA
jgi:hypothetical protein